MSESNPTKATGGAHIRILVALMRYYLALRLSAAIIAPTTVSAEWLATPAPVVRSYDSRRRDPFDEREILELGSHSLVLIRPLDPDVPEAICPN